MHTRNLDRWQVFLKLPLGVGPTDEGRLKELSLLYCCSYRRRRRAAVHDEDEIVTSFGESSASLGRTSSCKVPGWVAARIALIPQLGFAYTALFASSSAVSDMLRT